MALAMKSSASSYRTASFQRAAKVCKANRVVVAAPKSRGALHIVNYRDAASVENASHRSETVHAIGREVLDAWFTGIKEGSQGTGLTQGALNNYCTQDIHFRRNQALAAEEGKGLDFLRQQLDKEHSQYDIKDYRIVASAASEQDDTFFGLVEYTYANKATGTSETCVGFKVLEIDILLDDGARQVTCIHERGQLAPEDVPQGGEALCSAYVFPKDRLSSFPSGVKPDQVVDNVRAWCKARSSDESEAELDNVLDKSFRLYDAYGMLPALTGPEHSAKPEAAVVPYDKVKDLVKQSKGRYHVDCHLVDAAVSTSSNVAFSHWRSRFSSGKGGSGDSSEFCLEGIEVDVFGQDGKLTDIWLFRDPMDFERDMLKKA